MGGAHIGGSRLESSLGLTVTARGRVWEGPHCSLVRMFKRLKLFAPHLCYAAALLIGSMHGGDSVVTQVDGDLGQVLLLQIPAQSLHTLQQTPLHIRE